MMTAARARTLRSSQAIARSAGAGSHPRVEERPGARELVEVALAGEGDGGDHEDELAGEDQGGAALEGLGEWAEARDVVETGEDNYGHRRPGEWAGAPRDVQQRARPLRAGGGQHRDDLREDAADPHDHGGDMEPDGEQGHRVSAATTDSTSAKSSNKRSGAWAASSPRE